MGPARRSRSARPLAGGGFVLALALLPFLRLRVVGAALLDGSNGARCNSGVIPTPIALTVNSWALYTFSAPLACQEFNYTLAGGFVATFSIEDQYNMPLGYHRYEIYSVLGAGVSYGTNQVDYTSKATGAGQMKNTASASLDRCGASVLEGLTRFGVLNTDEQNSGMQFNYTLSIRPCPGSILGIAPLDGPRVGGNLVTVTGRDILTGSGDLVAASSSFGPRTLTTAHVVSVSTDRATVVVRVPTAAASASEPATSVTVTVVSSFHGTSVSPAYTLNPDSYLQRISPFPNGPSSFAYPVVLTATNLIPGDASFLAYIAGYPLSAVSVINSTALAATIPVRPAALSAGTPIPFNATSVRTGTFSGYFSWNPDLTFDSLTPRDNGPAVGGNLITVRGYGFIQDDVTLTASIGNATGRLPCPSIVVWPPENGEAYSRTVVITVPALKAPLAANYMYDVLLDSVRSGSWAYRAVYRYNPQVEVRSLAPNADLTHDNGPAAGGLPVFLVGINFVPGDTTARVLSGATEFANVTVLNATHVSCVQPAAGSNLLNTPYPVLFFSLRAGNSTGPSYTWNALITMANLKPFPDAPKAGKTLTIFGTNFVVGDTTLRAYLTDDAGGSVRVGNPFPLRFYAAGTPWSTAAEVLLPARTAGAWTAGATYRLSVFSTRSSGGNNTLAMRWLPDPTYGKLLPFEDTSPRMQAAAYLTGTNFVPEDGVSATVVRVWTPLGEELRASEVKVTGTGIMEWKWPTFGADYLAVRTPSNLSIVSERWGELFRANAFLWNPYPTFESFAPTWRIAASGLPVGSGPWYGGNPITVKGRNFLPGPLTVFIDKQIGYNANVTDNSTIIFRPPAANGALGAASPILPVSHTVRIVSDRFGVVANKDFLYAFNGRTVIESALPKDGPLVGNVLTVTGTNFVVGSEDQFAVTLAGLPMEARVASATRILVTVPSLPSGLSTEVPYDLLIDSYRFGTYLTPLAYAWNNPARLDTLSPLSGPLNGGNLLTLSGYNMADSIPDILSFSVAGVAIRAALVVSAAPDRIVFRAPNGISVGLVQGPLLLDSARFGKSSLAAAYQYVPGTAAPDSLVFTLRLNYTYALFGDEAHDMLLASLASALRISTWRFVVLSKTEGSTLLIVEVKESSPADQATGEVSASEVSRRLKALLAVPGGLDLGPAFPVLASAVTIDVETTRMPVALIVGVVAGVGGLILVAGALVAIVAIFRRTRPGEEPPSTPVRPINVLSKPPSPLEAEPAAPRAPLTADTARVWPAALSLGKASTLDARAAAQPRPRQWVDPKVEAPAARAGPRLTVDDEKAAAQAEAAAKGSDVVLGYPVEGGGGGEKEEKAEGGARAHGAAILAAVAATHWRPRPREAPRPGEPARRARGVFAAYYDRANAGETELRPPDAAAPSGRPPPPPPPGRA